MTSVDFVVLIVREPLMQIIAVHRSTPGSWSPVMICTGVLIVRSNVRAWAVLLCTHEGSARILRSDLLRRSLGIVRNVRELVALDKCKNESTLVADRSCEWFDVRRSQNVVENTADLNWHCGGAVADDDAPRRLGCFAAANRSVDVPISGPTACGRLSPNSLMA